MSSDVELLPCSVEHELRVDAAIIRNGIDGVRGPINREALADRLGRYAHAAAAQAAEIERLRAEVSGLRAARIAYANEFPATEDGDPDTGNIHANIRALKARAERLQAEVERLRSLCAAAYQMAGVHDAPDEWLDALSNAASGRKFSIDGLLPYMPDAVCEAYARAERLAEALRWAERHCPCGARPESPDTHPHMPGCLVGAALAQEGGE